MSKQTLQKYGGTRHESKKVTVGIRSTEDVLAEAATTMKAVAAGQAVKPKRRRLFFTSPEALRRFLTPKRIDLIHLIRQTSA